MSEGAQPALRWGLGIDIHPRDESRPLFLGGVRFEGEPGLRGHSDGDVICHAVADALLGAAGLGDLGMHFPDSDPSFAGIGGVEILRRVVTKLRERGLAPSAFDLTLVADRPHIGTRRREISQAISEATGVAESDVSVKATRPEGLGLTGDGAACMALATVAPLTGP